ncbi:class I SAM-dependent methyltransferase [Ectobacillus ponti]|uniref:SAM-dependent methyltransferase n=1 Tax=Ectobacillus ponti TaxID=2961894 RepID=A0AA42BQC3_9BACI|nr:rRNA adenine N-6-methyltransferase family protein [Ectobacillus ponti]MCP8970150.1 SAM-dependent methyltransferase [Ectobacillus ponti]
MNALRFIQEYMKNPSEVGAVMPSSRQLARQMIEAVDFQTASCMVEYGPGTGVFTDELVRNKRPGTTLLLLERNADFCKELEKKYHHVPNMYVIHDSAAEVSQYLAKYGYSKADYIISGLPFTSLPAGVSRQILQQTIQVLGEEGKFITFQYTKVKQKFFHSYFPCIHTKRVYWNVPPAFVFTCSKQ